MTPPSSMPPNPAGDGACCRRPAIASRERSIRMSTSSCFTATTKPTGPTTAPSRSRLHAFLRSIGRRVDGRTYEQLRGALSRLERTTLESSGVYFDAATSTRLDGRFTILSSISIERRRSNEREQLALFPALTASEPGDARVTISPAIRSNISAGHTATLSAPRYLSLSSPVARRLYRLLEVAREDGTVTWRIALDQLAEQLPLAQRYPSHLQRVLQPAHQMLLSAGLARDIAFRQQRREWFVDYVLASRLV